MFPICCTYFCTFFTRAFVISGMFGADDEFDRCLFGLLDWYGKYCVDDDVDGGSTC